MMRTLRILVPVVIRILRFLVIIVAIVAIVYKFKSNRTQAPEPPNAEDVQNIKKLLQQQQQDWNNGNIAGFMTGYWEDDSMRFISSNGTRYGHANTLKAYQKHYPTKAAMGQLTFTIEHVGALAEGSALAMASGRWKITDSPEAGGGYFSLILRKFNGNWKIIADHTWADAP
jgi:ketosteroid isomerase-like protein